MSRRRAAAQRGAHPRSATTSTSRRVRPSAAGRDGHVHGDRGVHRRQHARRHRARAVAARTAQQLHGAARPALQPARRRPREPGRVHGGSIEFTALAPSWSPPLSHADDFGARGEQQGPADYTWYALCKKETGDIVYGESTDPTALLRHGRTVPRAAQRAILDRAELSPLALHRLRSVRRRSGALAGAWVVRRLRQERPPGLCDGELRRDAALDPAGAPLWRAGSGSVDPAQLSGATVHAERRVRGGPGAHGRPLGRGVQQDRRRRRAHRVPGPGQPMGVGREPLRRDRRPRVGQPALPELALRPRRQVPGRQCALGRRCAAPVRRARRDAPG